MIRLLALDLDGTLLNSDKRISDGNKSAIHYAMTHGVHVVVCSGRIYDGAKMFAYEIGTQEPVIACNGAVIKTLDGETLFEDLLPFEAMSRVLDIVHEEDVYFHVYQGETMFCERLEFSSRFYTERNKELPERLRVDIQVKQDVNRWVLDSGILPTKIVAISKNPEVLKRARARAEEIPGIRVLSSGADNFEVMNHSADKSRALAWLAARMGIAPEEVMAIGDNENDADMLLYAGTGVAMGNAIPAVIEISDHVTLENNEDGVAHAIYQFIGGQSRS